MNGIDGSLELLCPQHSNKSRQKARQKRLPLSLLASPLTLKGSRRCLCSLTGGPSSLSSTVPITSGHRRYRYAVLCDHLCSPLSLHPYEYRAMGDKVRIVCVCLCSIGLRNRGDAASSSEGRLTLHRASCKATSCISQRQFLCHLYFQLIGSRAPGTQIWPVTLSSERNGASHCLARRIWEALHATFDGCTLP